MSTKVSADQLNRIKSQYTNAIINGMPLQALINAAGAHISAQFVDFDVDALKEHVISASNLETWQQFIEITADKPTESYE